MTDTRTLSDDEIKTEWPQGSTADPVAATDDDDDDDATDTDTTDTSDDTDTTDSA